ncbi:MAG: ATP-dependent DNA helicase RecQ, partial [Myxococcota bacterium]
ALEAGNDVVLVLPTGGGKSVVYQVPAISAAREGRGPTLVVSPLIALMEDQVRSLRARGVTAVALHSGIPWKEQREALSHLIGTALIYASPERLQNERFRALLKRVGLAYSAVDEAHCISEWGHDFRPEYKKLSFLVSELGAPVLAATATATPRVRREIATSLTLRDPVEVVGPVERENLSLFVTPCAGDIERVDRCVALLRDGGFAVKTAPGRAIVYVITRKRAQQVCKSLRAAKIQAAYYHAGRTEGARANAQKGFEDGKYSVLVATSAFGMGVDLPDVRFVIHVQAPGTLEGYAQQAGRAGRDGLPAQCHLLWGAGDAVTHRRLRGASPSEGAVEGWKGLEGYALSRTCRQAQIVRWFTLEDGVACGHCDVCTNHEAVDVAAVAFEKRAGDRDAARRKKRGEDSSARCTPEQVESIVAFIGGLKKPLGRRLIAQGLRGSSAKAVKRKGLANNEQYGALRGVPEIAVFRGIDTLLEAGRLVPKGRKYPTIWLADKAVRPKRAPGERTARPGVSPAERELRNFRSRVARAGRLKPYQVFSNKTLKLLLTERPSTRDALGEVWGMGPRRVAKYGDEILELLR